MQAIYLFFSAIHLLHAFLQFAMSHTVPIKIVHTLPSLCGLMPNPREMRERGVVRTGVDRLISDNTARALHSRPQTPRAEQCPHSHSRSLYGKKFRQLNSFSRQI